MIAQDPRPAYQQGKETDRVYGISLYEFNIKWRIKAGTTDCVEILDIQKLKESNPYIPLRDDNTLSYSQYRDTLLDAKYVEK